MFFMFVAYCDDRTWEPVFDELAPALMAFLQVAMDPDVFSVSLDYCRD